MPVLDGPQRRQIAVLVSVIYIILTWTKEMGASGIFSDYLSKVLRRHTEQACDGGHLNLHCPRDTTISIQSAFYGRKVPSSLLCPGLDPRNTVEENLNCTAPTTLQKILDECQDQQSCQLPVNRRVFGLDPCPGTSKYLLVSYKCKPKCLSHTALEIVSTSCYGKQNCKIIASSHYFGDPCFPGMQKYLSVIYVCVSKLLLQEVDPSFSGLTPSWVYNENANRSLGPQESRFSMKGGKIVISTLVIFAYIKSNPEMVGLLFVSSVCIGLIFTMCAIVIRVSCRPDLQKICNGRSNDRKVDCCQDEDDNEDNTNDDEDESSDDDDDEESSSDFTFEGLTKLYGTIGSNSTEAAEIAERIERRDRIIQEIWMNGGLELPVIRNLNQYY
ncbi:protein eva-1 homolog C isoform X3 [Heterodontus francisci]|uniref:protein eva-1 homolog C isoform X3 n=1 Tax=Heterodontus francisci TaxID=7792 RepID=UPI00355C0526